ncbi:hypothetical protein D3871_15550 [Noviherbaspirillum saxi]|uniref:Uncharacterized protein n=1 Tax=Noviherbaspirillum saxi TaxID=2320863 RepID=A0A3A3FU83_9BURK|nr:hypothetical protein D3871_15550 [Noviherbaspirillum saxi]
MHELWENKELLKTHGEGAALASFGNAVDGHTRYLRRLAEL